MGQHKSFSKDIDLLAEAYGAVGGTHFMHGVGVADQAAEHMAAEDGEDKTGHDSDRGLLAAVEKKHTAGKALIHKAHSEIDQHGSLSAHTRDSLARDDYGYHGEDEEATTPIGDPEGDTDEVDQAHFKKYQGQIDPKAKAAGWNPDAN